MESANPPQIRIKDRNSVEIGNITYTTGIKVFDLAGNMILSETTSSAITLNLNNGLYLIKVGEKTFKVSL